MIARYYPAPRPPASGPPARRGAASPGTGPVGSPGPLDPAAALAEAWSEMEPGDRLVLRRDDQTTVELRKGSASTVDDLGRALKELASSGRAQVVDLVANDPSFAFRQVAEVLRGVVLDGVPFPIRRHAEQGFYPVVRGASMALDAAQAHKTLRDGEASALDRAVDVAHVVTDGVGLAGLALMATSSADLGARLGAVAVVGDLVASGYHLVRRVGRRPPDPARADLAAPISSRGGANRLPGHHEQES